MEVIYIGREKLVVEKIQQDKTGRYYVMNIEIEGDVIKVKLRLDLDKNNRVIGYNEV